MTSANANTATNSTLRGQRLQLQQLEAADPKTAQLSSAQFDMQANIHSPANVLASIRTSPQVSQCALLLGSPLAIARSAPAAATLPDGQPTLHWWITRQARDKVGRLLDLNDVIALQANSLPCLRKSFPSWGHTYRFTPATSEIIIGCEEKRATGDFLLSSLHLTACPCWLACWWRL